LPFWGSRTLKAIGGNPEVVRLAGLPGGLYTAMAYALSAILCCISGIILTSRLNVGSPMSGVGLELDAIAAVVIGGASLSGGKGSVLNTMFGVLTLGLIGNIMNILGVPSYPQQIIKGIIILLAFIAGNEESIGSLFARFGLIKKRAA
jgi:ribose transport system permease protein